MAHVTGTDLQDLQFDALGTTTLGNPQLPASPLPAANKALKTSSKVIIGAINEVLSSNATVTASFNALASTYNNIIGDVGSNPQLLTDLQKIEQNLILAVLKVYKDIHGVDLDNPQTLSGSVVDMITAATIATGTAQQYVRGDHTLAVLDTDAVAEATNKYYTDARVIAYLSGIANTPSNPAFLNASGKIDSSLLTISAGLTYTGLWDPTTNTPTLPTTPDAGSNGVWYKVSADGSWNGTNWYIGDWIVSSGAAWERVDNTAFVVDVFGRKGSIVAQATDYASFYVSLSGSYSDPVWLTGVNANKIVGVVAPANLGTGTADTTTFLRGDGSWSTLPTSGTVTSVGVDMPASEFSVSLSPITSSGVIGVTWKTQAALTVFAAPVAGGTPSFRALVSDDIPVLDAAKISTGVFTASQIPDLDAAKISTGIIGSARLGTGTADASTVLHGDGTWGAVSSAYVTSVALALPSIFTVSGSPVTSAGTLSADLAVQAQGTVFAGPGTGADAQPGFRLLLATDIPDLDAARISTGVFDAARIPDLDAAKISTGVIAVSRIGTGTADTTVFLRGDGSWAIVPASGTVTSVGLAAPVEFTVTNSPVTGAGTLTLEWVAATANTVFAGPDGASGVPGFRALLAADIPTLDAAKIGTGTFTSSQIPDLDAAKVTTGVFDAARVPDLDAAKIVSGTVSTARLGSGTADTTTFLRGDGSWQVVATTAVTSVGLALPAEFTVTNSPVTGTGTLTGTWASQTANFVFAAPDGAAGTPGFRLLLESDIPSLDAAKISTGVVAVARLGTGTADNTTFLRGDGTWQTVSASGSVTSVGLSLPAEFTVTNSPVTGAGVLTGAWATQAANLVFAGPALGADAAPGFRALTVADLGTGTADTTKFLRGDGTWSAASTGVFQAVKLAATNNNFGTYSGLLTGSATFNAHGWHVSGAAVDTKTWDLLATATSFEGRLVDDANVTVTGWLKVDRAAMVATKITLGATAIQFNGAVTATSTLSQLNPALAGLTVQADATGAYAGISFNVPGAAANGRYSYIRASATGMVFRFYDDAGGGSDFLSINRTAGTRDVSSVTVTGPIIMLQGAVTVSGTGTLTANNGITAASFTKSGGLSTQYLMADGTVSTGVAFAAQSKNRFLAGPVSGSAAVPSFRILDNADFAGLEPTFYGMTISASTFSTTLVMEAGGTDAKRYTIQSGNDVGNVGYLNYGLENDARNASTVWLLHKRAGIVSTELTLTAATIKLTGAVIATSVAITGGANNQYLMADGSVSSGSTFSGTYSGGILTLDNATYNRINYAAAGNAAPSFSTRSAGTKLVLWPLVSATFVDYAIGIEAGAGTLWTTVPRAANPYQFVWYGGTTQLAVLTGTGTFTVNGTITATGLSTASGFKIPGGANTEYLMADGSVRSGATFASDSGTWGNDTLVAKTASAIGTAAGIGLYVIGATTDNKYFDIISAAGGVTFGFTNDGLNSAISFLSANRTGNSPTTVSLVGVTTQIGFNGANQASIVYVGTNSGGSTYIGYNGSDWCSTLHLRSGGTINLGIANTTAINIGSASSTTTFAGTVTGLAGSAISSGTVAVACLGSGTASSSTYLRGDGTWATVSVTTPVYQMAAPGMYIGYDGGGSQSTNVYIGTNSGGTLNLGYNGYNWGAVVNLNCGGTVNVGTQNTSAVNIGAAGVTTTFAGTVNGLSLGAAKANTVWNNANGVAGTSGAWTKITGYSANLHTGAPSPLSFDTTNDRYTATTAGWYMVSATVMIQSTSGTITQANAVTYYTQGSIYKNGAGVCMTSAPITYIAGNCQCYATISSMVYLAVNDYVEHWYYTNMPSPNVYYSYNSVPFTIFSIALLK